MKDYINYIDMQLENFVEDDLNYGFVWGFVLGIFSVLVLYFLGRIFEVLAMVFSMFM